ncbi:hypothetical protein FPSE_02363 [Fusarium pseudograminearum CS3096]|uniref:Zn(2)-C6 fungal-type domain-containing protein n=1 Tax=Fusarium pseudograminearum (strain CS3096) TaxID=1028729 RepID=K3W2E1_FUSPC|nr:hypothetical protein FPSE_02363 [Fusarium pseudograminearum CS3096]EKJ77490.1 hypothetical protein FPSE_02363 [Fusarium pseudograminearum CS3096]
MPRGRRGCWTCRIRHRRCDESSPECKECSTRSITCHGYDIDPPQWMSNDKLLQEELRRIKGAVKENFRRVKTIQNRQLARLTAEETQASRAKPSSQSLGDQVPNPTPVGSSTTNTIFKEAQYLVHYLDYIFPIQYAFYVDAPHQGGRGWLFFLLERNAPLRNAALTLSAFHQHTLSPYHTESQEDELLKYHTKALQELRHVVRHRDVGASADNIEEWLKFLAGGMFLISFEVFQGGTNHWQAHFNALVSVIQNLTSSDFDFDASDPSSSDFDFQRGMNTAQKFLLSNLVWIDILAPLATGTAPKLPYHDWLNAGKIDMSRVMGCSNCIMIAIGDMMALSSEASTLDGDDLGIAIRGLEKRIMGGIDAALDGASSLTPTNRSVTHLFATAALVQLYTIASENGISSPDPHTAVSRVIEVLNHLPPHISLRATPWPLCVAGSMALPPNEQYFDDLFKKLMDNAEAGFTNCVSVATKILQYFPQLEKHHFAADALWRDTYVLTSTIRTFYYDDSVAAEWHILINSHGLSRASTVLGSAKVISPGDGIAWVDCTFTFESLTPAINCSDILSLVPSPDGSWNIWVLRTILEQVTMVQRSRTFVLPAELIEERYVIIYNDKIPSEVSDRAMFSHPVSIARHLSSGAFHAMTRPQPERYEALERAGFKVDPFGDIQDAVNIRLGGHYINVGTSAKIGKKLV